MNAQQQTQYNRVILDRPEPVYAIRSFISKSLRGGRSKLTVDYVRNGAGFIRRFQTREAASAFGWNSFKIVPGLCLQGAFEVVELRSIIQIRGGYCARCGCMFGYPGDRTISDNTCPDCGCDAAERDAILPPTQG